MTQQGMYATGTVRENRTSKCPIPSKSEMLKKERGCYDSRLENNSNVICVTWKDNSPVNLFSYVHGVNPVQEAKRYSVTEKKNIGIPQPNIVARYNKNMCGEDLMDNFVSNYRIGVRGKKWYMPIVF